MASGILGSFADAVVAASSTFSKTLKERAGKKEDPMLNVHLEVKNEQEGRIVALTCPRCNASVQLPEGKTSGYCAYCGTPIAYDDGSVTVTYRTEDAVKLKEAETEAALKLRQLEIEEQRRPGRLKLMAILALVGMLMLLVGSFAGSASGDSSSPWYFMSMLGFFPLLGVAYIWLSMQHKN